jgi:DNA-binding transcriptional ArsR family regulator
LPRGRSTPGGICEALKQRHPATSHHLALLRHSRIITRRRQGKNSFYALTEAGERLASIIKNVAG